MFIICYESLPKDYPSPRLSVFKGKGCNTVLDPEKALRYKTHKGATTIAQKSVPDGFSFAIVPFPFN